MARAHGSRTLSEYERADHHRTADCGGSNGARVRLWKVELQKFAVRDPVGAMHSALRLAHAPRGVFQAMTLPASEVAAAKYATATMPAPQRAASRQAVTARGARERIKYEHEGYANKAADPILVD
jgi:hypothetical protein